MNIRRAMFIAVLGLAAAVSPAWAQAPAGGGRQMPPCIKKFLTLRDSAQAKGKRLQAMGQRKQKPTAAEACHLLNDFWTAEGKLLKYAADNETWCGIPPQVVTNMTKAHKRTTQMRARVCRVAAEERDRPRGPTLSEALGATAPTANNVRPGGTYDTLTGSALGRQ